MTQPENVAAYIKEHSIATTDELRNKFHYADVPKAVSLAIHKLHYPIVAKRNPNGSATYYWGKLPEKKVYNADDYDWSNGRARLKKDIKPEQLHI
jgi:hypothetical protein